MKKEKLFNIDLVNKSSVQIVKNTTTFYTSDTELWLGFELLEKEHTFDSAEILLLNKDDRSFIIRSVTQSQDKYWYELESDIIAHYGEWIGQLQFTKDGEVFTSKQFAFRIENDLSNDRPPQLTEVNNWKNLRTIADGLIDDIRVELESLAKQELEIENAEQSRQSAEHQRIESETLRVENETKRELEINKIRNEVFNNTKIKLVNLVENGDFSDGLLGWKSHQGGVIEVVDSRLKIDTSPTNYSGVSQPINVKYDTNDIIYTNVRVYNPNDHDITLNFQYTSVTNLVKISPTFNGVVSNVQTIYKSVPNPIYYITKNSISDQYSFFIDNVILLNLTKIFGAGNEPTKETMDWIINTNGYFDELAIVRDDIQQYEINQLRKAVLALGGTI